MNRNRHRDGFMMTELIVIALVISVVVCLTTPLIVRMREAARLTQCTDRLREIGLACGEFARVERSVLPSNRSKPYTGWNTQILPYIDQEELFQQYRFDHDWWNTKNSMNRAVGETRIATFVCPNTPHGDRWVRLKDPDGGAFKTAPTDYVACSGAYLQNNIPENLYRGAMASPGRVYGASGVTAGPAVKLAEVTDGQSNTLIVVEMADKPNKWQAGKMTDHKTESDNASTLVPSFSFGQWVGPNWNHLRSYDHDGQAQFGPCAVNCSNGGSIYGFHKGGANVAFVDGSVRMLKAGLAQEIMVALVSIADGEILSPADY